MAIGFVIKAAMFIALIKIALISRSAILSASIYAFVVLLFSVLGGTAFLSILLKVAFGFGLSWGYYWLLIRYEGTFLFWLILIAGMVILFL